MTRTETIRIRDSSHDRDLTRPELVGFCIGKLQNINEGLYYAIREILEGEISVDAKRRIEFAAGNRLLRACSNVCVYTV